MKILITNDDGISSKGMKHLAEVLSSKHEVWIVAPDQERSAVSHGVTLRTAVQFFNLAERVYSCSGTPADCILYSLKGALPVIPDLVISGINRGYNIGTDVVYSGTVAAAREGVFQGVPSIAVSAAISKETAEEWSYVAGTDFLEQHLDQLIQLWKPHILINVNIPEHAHGEWKLVGLAQRNYNDMLHVVHHSESTSEYKLVGDFPHPGETCAWGEMGTDQYEVAKGTITVSLVHAYPQIESDEIIRK